MPIYRAKLNCLANQCLGAFPQIHSSTHAFFWKVYLVSEGVSYKGGDQC